MIRKVVKKIRNCRTCVYGDYKCKPPRCTEPNVSDMEVGSVLINDDPCTKFKFRKREEGL